MLAVLFDRMQSNLENAIYGVDPGEKETGWVLWDGKRVLDMGVTLNEEFLERLRTSQVEVPMYIEMIASYGMGVGKSTFETCVWIGRFVEVWSILGYPWQFCYRTNIRTHHCHSAKAGDSNVSIAIRDKYGDKGTRRNPGPFFGVKSHIWSAIAIATYALETNLPCSSTVG